MAVHGFAHHTFMCSDCHDVERRIGFIKNGRQGDAVPMLVHRAPSIAQPATDEPVGAARAP
jgi:hypothetical protein